MNESFNQARFQDIEIVRNQMLTAHTHKRLNWTHISEESPTEHVVLTPALLGLLLAGLPMAEKIGSNTTACLGALAWLTYIFVSGDSFLIGYRETKARIINAVHAAAINKGVNDFLHAEYHTN
ncbi:hypothetical protein C5B42_02200 [Candidatus Cerribacteria bacterium 'Amazon FNV 2010 28 9']|uniref:Uncharacterized protein n=1 Tax=Candidatus Cerribacteria bacterium 'Amazon FNV 2010 28 9' TaxID=2081795 RepID=A0A317JRX0_9BACT|nr:MAG: hypothetical protein C5B42_02200 [Candidatus Cerribacteria bacterium 'Amazon FNV 2010 28 9']